MIFPQQISALRNKYERGQVALCGLFLSTVRQAGMSQYSHVQGKVNSIIKLDRHFYGLFGFMAIKDSEIWTHSPNPETTFCIQRAIRWLHANNHLNSSFLSRFETLLRYVKSEFINPSLLDNLYGPLEKVLEDEAAELAFPLDAKYFDQFPIVSNDDRADIAGRPPKLSMRA